VDLLIGTFNKKALREFSFPEGLITKSVVTFWQNITKYLGQN